MIKVANGWALLAVSAALSGLVVPLPAQVVRIRVTEAESGQPVLGALVSLERDGKVRVARALSDAGGRVALRGTGAATYRVRADRIGYEGLFSESFVLGPGDSVSLALKMPGTRVMLPDIIVNSKRVCDLDRETGTTLAALWGEAKKALTGTSLTGLRPPELDVTTFERDLDRSGRIIRDQSTTARRAVARPFVSADPAALIERGFVDQGAIETGYSGPDADVLLSDSFLSVHCFRVIRAPEGESTLVGLAFEPVKGRKVPEIKGTLWLDRRSAELRFLEFAYTNLDHQVSAGQEGGRIEFQRLPTGGWIVNDWVIRMPMLARIEARTVAGNYERRDSLIGIRESGGRAELVAIGGPEPSRAILAGTVFDSVAGAPLAGALVTIAGGAYRATTDSAGRYRIETPTRGDFLITVDHPRIRLLSDGPVLGSARLNRGHQTTVALALPPLARLEPYLCGGDPGDPDKSAILAGVLTDSSGVSIPFGTVTFRWMTVARLTQSMVGVFVYQRARVATVTADRNGVFRICGVPRISRVWVTAAGGFTPAVTSLLVGAERLAVRNVELAARERLAGQAVVRVKIVAQQGAAPVAGALVSLAPSGDSARADAGGAAVFVGVREGHHLIEVRALGFEPAAQEIEVAGRDTAHVTVALAQTAVVLAPLEVAAAPRVHPMMVGFEERRKEGLGHYFTLGQLKTREYSTLANVLRMSPGMYLVPMPSPCSGHAAATARSRSGVQRLCQGSPLPNACFLAVFVNGINIWTAVHTEPPPDLDQFHVNDLEGVEVYVGPAQLPAQYHVSGADCGAILIWQRVSGSD